MMWPSQSLEGVVTVLSRESEDERRMSGLRRVSILLDDLLAGVALELFGREDSEKITSRSEERYKLE